MLIPLNETYGLIYHRDKNLKSDFANTCFAIYKMYEEIPNELSFVKQENAEEIDRDQGWDTQDGERQKERDRMFTGPFLLQIIYSYKDDITDSIYKSEDNSKMQSKEECHTRYLHILATV
jgi:hypothetical protein